MGFYSIKARFEWRETNMLTLTQLHSYFSFKLETRQWIRSQAQFRADTFSKRV